MVFNSLQFLVFFVVVLAAYPLLAHRRQNQFLLIASYVFYGTWDYRFLALLLISTLVDFYTAGLIEGENRPYRRKRLLAVSIVVNLVILGFFKYFDFFAESFTELAAAFGLGVSPITLNVILPVGISFYTFQSMSYTIDVYRGKLPASRSLPEFALFVAFFPQLVAGPIERARNLLPQIARPRTMTAAKAGTGASLVLRGLFKKVVVADNLAPTVDTIFAQPTVAGEDVVIGSIYFAFQMYCDFSGYSDIARGVARMLGFELMVNFRQPFFAKSPEDFLRRWHISLGTWLRDYLFRPLGGMSRSPMLMIRNLTITLVLAGLWHGAAWNFVLWGAYMAALFVVSRMYHLHVLPHVSAIAGARRVGIARSILSVPSRFFLILYGFMLFRSTSLAQIVDMTAALGNFDSIMPLLDNGLKFLLLAGPVILLDLYSERRKEDESHLELPLWPQTAAYASAAMLFLMIGNYDADSFIYFQF